MSIDKTSKEYYLEVLNSGMFSKLYPTLTGDWEIDEVKWKFIHQNQLFDVMKINIDREPSIKEVWYEGSVTYKGLEHKFWLIEPQDCDYELEVRWFFKSVPMEVRRQYVEIIETFKKINHDRRQNKNGSNVQSY